MSHDLLVQVAYCIVVAYIGYIGTHGLIEKWDHVYFVHPLTDTSVDSRRMYRSTYQLSIGRYVDQHIGRHVDRDVSVDISTDVYRPSDGRHIDRDICR